MKTINIIIFLMPLALLSSCGGSGSPGTSASDPEISGDVTSMSSPDGTSLFDRNTELQTGLSGLTLAKVYIVDGNDKKISGSDIPLNSKFSIIYEGVKNYTLKEGKAFPALSLLISDADQNPVINEADLLASYSEGLSESDASVLRATVTVGDPMKPGEYTCTVHVVDKNNVDAAIISTWSFDVK